jgi:type II secretory pathway pseudopilin PulG
MSQNRIKGISLIALIITIIVIIILATIIVSSALNTPERASLARFIGDMSEIQQAVSIKTTENLKINPDGSLAVKNTGFTKIMIKKTASGEFEDGWVVNLNNINVSNSTLGNSYGTIQVDDQITFGPAAPDVYVYDSKGQVFYAKGYVNSGNVAFSIDEALNGGTASTPSGSNEVIEPDNPTDWAFTSATGVITKYNGPDVQELVIPNSINGTTITGIAGDPYNGGIISTDSTIASVVISPGIKNIGDYALCDFGGTSITLPDGLETIGTVAIYRCLNLTTINIPDTVTSIGANAFGSCNALTEIVVPNSVTSLGDRAFMYCRNLTSITLSDNITSFGSYVFGFCNNLLSINFPPNLTSIGECAFIQCLYLNDIIIPSSVTSIHSNTFPQCNSLTDITVNRAQFPDEPAPWGAPYATVTWNP